LVKSHHHQLFPNGKFLVFLKIYFSIFYKLKCEITTTRTIFMKFRTFLVLPLREFFYVFPSYGTFLKVYIRNIFFPFLKNCFSNFKVLLKKKNEYCPKCYTFHMVFLQWPLYKFLSNMYNILVGILTFSIVTIHNLFIHCLKMHFRIFLITLLTSNKIQQKYGNFIIGTMCNCIFRHI